METEIIEVLSQWKADGDLEGVYFNQVESEHSVMSAALGAEATGARTFTASSSQGLLLMHEIMYNVSGMRLPVVFVNVSRGVSAPITLWPDHNDILAMRDTGWIIFMCETNQEVLDSVIMGYKIGENEKVLLPVIVNMDGFIHSYTRSPVNIPAQSVIDRFLPKLKLKLKLDVDDPKSLGVPALGKEYMYFRSQQHKALTDSKSVIKKVQKEWSRQIGRKYEVIESYKMGGAKAALVIAGATSTIAKAAVDEMRKNGKKVGLVRIRLLRPFPEKEIRDALKGINHIGVIDQNICPGMSGILFPEIKMALYGAKPTISNYIISLGGNPISKGHFMEIFDELLKSKKEERKWVMQNQ